MAWIIGVVSDEELEQLRKIGWKDEDPPQTLPLRTNKGSVQAFFVDNDVYNIMTGPDWEKPTS
ncbi:MAG: hypothetical protein WC119_00815 [Synergistaceae bacterium]